MPENMAESPDIGVTLPARSVEEKHKEAFFPLLPERKRKQKKTNLPGEKGKKEEAENKIGKTGKRKTRKQSGTELELKLDWK